MRLGIDFGTRRTVVAVVDRGNYPVVTFDDLAGAGHEHFPSAIAGRGGSLRFGFESDRARHDPGWGLRRSLKRHLTDPRHDPELFGRPVEEIARQFLTGLRSALLHRSNLDTDERLEVAIAVPANAAGAQRLRTSDAFRDAGFEVVRMLDEPSAAAPEACRP